MDKKINRKYRPDANEIAFRVVQEPTNEDNIKSVLKKTDLKTTTIQNKKD